MLDYCRRKHFVVTFKQLLTTRRNQQVYSDTFSIEYGYPPNQIHNQSENTGGEISMPSLPLLTYWYQRRQVWPLYPYYISRVQGVNQKEPLQWYYYGFSKKPECPCFCVIYFICNSLSQLPRFILYVVTIKMKWVYPMFLSRGLFKIISYNTKLIRYICHW